MTRTGFVLAVAALFAVSGVGRAQQADSTPASTVIQVGFVKNQSCDGCKDGSGSYVIRFRKVARSKDCCSAAPCTTCDTCVSECCHKESCLRHLIDWLTYHPVKTHECKEHNPCCTPRLYTFFMCDCCNPLPYPTACETCANCPTCEPCSRHRLLKHDKKCASCEGCSSCETCVPVSKPCDTCASDCGNKPHYTGVLGNCWNK